MNTNQDWIPPDGLVQSHLQTRAQRGMNDPWQLDQESIVMLRRLVLMGAYDTVSTYLAQIRDLHPYHLHYFNGLACTNPFVQSIPRVLYTWLHAIVMKERLEVIWMEHVNGVLDYKASHAEIWLYLQAEMYNPNKETFQYQVDCLRYAAEFVIQREHAYQIRELVGDILTSTPIPYASIAARIDILAKTIREEIVANGMCRSSDQEWDRIGVKNAWTGQTIPEFVRGQSVWWFDATMAADACTNPSQSGEGAGVVIESRWVEAEYGQPAAWKYRVQKVVDGFSSWTPVGAPDWFPGRMLEPYTPQCCNTPRECNPDNPDTCFHEDAINHILNCQKKSRGVTIAVNTNQPTAPVTIAVRPATVAPQEVTNSPKLNAAPKSSTIRIAAASEQPALPIATKRQATINIQSSLESSSSRLALPESNQSTSDQ